MSYELMSQGPKLPSDNVRRCQEKVRRQVETLCLRPDPDMITSSTVELESKKRPSLPGAKRKITNKPPSMCSSWKLK